MKPCVFIHTNEKQWVGALVGAHALRRNSATPEAFDVRFIHTRDYDYLRDREGQRFLRGGVQRVWRMDDLQSFTPLRFKPPELMGYEGRAIVIDPDIFAVGDVYELITRDMQGKALMGRPRTQRQKERPCLASSVMLLDCAQLRNWKCEEEFDALFRFERDYKDWIALRHEPPENVGILDPAWNDFDRLRPETRLLHNTKRRTQPWKTGLPIDFTPTVTGWKKRARNWLQEGQRRYLGREVIAKRYKPHPDPRQECFFFGLLRECLDQGIVSEDMLREEMGRNHVRHDALEVIERTPPLAA